MTTEELKNNALNTIIFRGCPKAAKEAVRAYVTDLEINLNNALVALKEVTTERDEADRRAGAAERKAESLHETLTRNREWKQKQKKLAGFHESLSFDHAWSAALAALKEKREREGV